MFENLWGEKESSEEANVRVEDSAAVIEAHGMPGIPENRNYR